MADDALEGTAAISYELMSVWIDLHLSGILSHNFMAFHFYSMSERVRSVCFRFTAQLFKFSFIPSFIVTPRYCVREPA